MNCLPHVDSSLHHLCDLPVTQWPSFAFVFFGLTLRTNTSEVEFLSQCK